MSIIKRITIGRLPNNDVVLADEKVSKLHATMWQNTNGLFFVEDENSTNGTYVNGARIKAKEAHSLKKNDQLLIGDTTVDWQNYFVITNTSTSIDKDAQLQKVKQGVRIFTYLMAIVGLVLLVLLFFWYHAFVVVPV